MVRGLPLSGMTFLENCPLPLQTTQMTVPPAQPLRVQGRCFWPEQTWQVAWSWLVPVQRLHSMTLCPEQELQGGRREKDSSS